MKLEIKITLQAVKHFSSFKTNTGQDVDAFKIRRSNRERFVSSDCG